ncbi:branched-chain amino acid ABC transporter substrate-binding protein [Mongoliimonas terrestris]|uniref:branched-chain amino acid ABC transporter substrate-binding protein n=1 Tax=Mongoliimonas terrestris TaxID=1709001 RepID=UPI0009499C0D|nr:branched-chain amino acid ABC transporter substrate-binding protein [Mongoliimonas terrestris]
MKKKYLLACVAMAATMLSAPAAFADIKIGVIGPMTGPNAVGGAQLKNGAEQAVADINAAGGILGEKIVLLVGDDASDPKQGVSVANQFVGEGVQFVIGHFNSGVTIPTSEIFAENGILQVTPAATNPKVTERGLWNIFRTCGRDDQQGALWGSYALKHFAGKKIAIVHDKTTYGQGLADVAKAEINKAGVTEVLYEGLNVGEKDFSALISKIKAAGADLVMWGGLHTEGGLLIRQMRDQGVAATVMGGDGINTSEFPAIGGEGAVGTLMSFGSDPRDNPGAKEVVAKFRAGGFEPEAFTLYSYAAAQVIEQAIKAAGTLEAPKVAEYMRTGVTFPTVIGDIVYDSKGDRKDVDFVMYEWVKKDDGKIDYVLAK